MANTWARGAAMAVVVAGILGAGGALAEAAVATVMVHVADYAGVSARELSVAEVTAGEVYARIGVRVEWTDGSAKLAPPDGALHVDVIILSDEIMERTKPVAGALGEASHFAKRAYIYYPRIFMQARRNGGEPAMALALVVAHELGHVLLPEYSHAPSGLMRANLEGRILNIPDFLPAQAEAIRAALTAK